MEIHDDKRAIGPATSNNGVMTAKTRNVGCVAGVVALLDDFVRRSDPHRLRRAERMARTVYALGRRCSISLGGSLCSDPGFSMLLDLFLCSTERRGLSVTALCCGSRVPTATALRYVNLLQEAGVVRRINDQLDRRRSFVILTEHGWTTMLDLLDPRPAIGSGGITQWTMIAS